MIFIVHYRRTQITTVLSDMHLGLRKPTKFTACLYLCRDGGRFEASSPLGQGPLTSVTVSSKLRWDQTAILGFVTSLITAYEIRRLLISVSIGLKRISDMQTSS